MEAKERDTILESLDAIRKDTREAREATQQTQVQVARLEERIANRGERTDERLDGIHEKLSGLELAVYGNGKPGLTDRVKEIEKQHEEEKARAEERRKEALKYKWGMIFFGSTTFIELILTLFHWK